jgi:hypothetical protein
MAAGVQTAANGRGDCGVRLQSEINNDDRSRSARRLFKGPAIRGLSFAAGNRDHSGFSTLLVTTRTWLGPRGLNQM